MGSRFESGRQGDESSLEHDRQRDERVRFEGPSNARFTAVAGLVEYDMAAPDSPGELRARHRSRATAAALGRLASRDVESPPRVDGDPSQCRRLARNVIDDATPYSGDGTPRISVFTANTEPTWIISVYDRGNWNRPGRRRPDLSGLRSAAETTADATGAATLISAAAAGRDGATEPPTNE